MTGINPVTLRAWERRYGLIKPQRTPKGHRLYTEADIARIQSILGLLERGIPISQAGQVLDEAPAACAPRQPRPLNVSDSGIWDQHRISWRKALQSFDEHALGDACDDSLSLFPVDLVMHRLASPLMQELSDHAVADADAGLRAQHYFFQSFLRHKLGARFIHDAARSAGPRLLMACPTGETDDIALLLLAVSAQAQGYRVVLLGINVDNDALLAAVRSSRCAGLVLASRCNRPPRGLLTALSDVNPPVFLLDAASAWPGTDAEQFIPMPDATTALRAIAQRLPAASGDGIRRNDYSGAV